MGFTEAVQTCLTKYFVFSGRASRSEYWYFILFVVLVRIVSTIADLVALGFLDHPRIGFGLITGVLLIVPQLAAVVRRLRDTEHSWWIVPVLIVLVIVDTVIVTRYLSYEAAIAIKLGIVVLLSVTAILFVVQFVWLVTPGTRGDNAYGPDPLASPRMQPD